MMVERSRFVAVSVLVAALVCYSDGQGLRQRVGDVTPSLVSKPGGAGHALMFRDQVLVKKDFKNFPSKALTFEAWISTSDFCHAGTIMSYSIDSHATDTDQRVADFNHFVIFDPRNVLACHDYTYIDLKPDYSNVSCHAGFRNVSRLDNTAKMTERDGQWHHLAVTWSVENEGLTEIFMDGLRVASSYSRKTKPLQPGGAFMIGGEQDCFGGCTDPTQGFYGFIDEVRLWSVVRSQEDILKHMRWASGLENHNDLAAYWKFNDPDTDNGQFRRHSVAKDSSGKGNDISLIQPPFRNDVTIQQGSSSLHTGTLLFQNNLALNRAAKNMPDGSFTVEFWARGPKIADADDTQEKYSQVFSYATQRKDGDRTVGPDFMDDAIRIERYLEDFGDRLGGHQSTRGAISVHINSNENTDSHRAQNWIDFDANWVDASWHHIAVTWEFDSGATKVYIDGEAKTPFWRSEHGMVEDKPAREGGVDMHLVAKTTRSAEGSLVLGQDQDCFGGCFSPSNAYNGDLAVVRIWNRARSQDDIRRNMWRERPDNEDGLSALYIFSADGLAVSDTGDAVALDRSPSKNNLQLRSNPPQWVYSYAPLVSPEGLPVAPPMPGAAGFALALHDKQVLMLPNFQDFPSDAITVEFWMQSVDTCRPGVPFSYAHGKYEKEDNSFLIFNYNSFGVSVMEDEGTLVDHLSGVSATDGNWHHIAVTWTSSTGETILYDNGYPRWKVTRSRGAKIPSGGTLVIGREQDCQGGCFDSATGASGKVSEVSDQEYGPQDFFGLIEEMRIWKVVRTPDQIKAGMRADDGRAASGFNKPGVDKDDTNLVAYWKFDEGAGYTVHDVTGHGHDLIMAEPPTWSVVRWLSSCGNAAVEGSEECDDGDNSGGDGCSPSCTIEDGWECEGSPSICRHTGAPPRPRPPVPGPTPTPQPSGGGEHGPTPSPGGGSGSSKSHGGAIAAAVLVPVFVLIFAGAAFAYRHIIYEQFPQVESAVDSAARGIGRLMPGGDKSSDRYAHLALDPEEVDMSPEFLAPTPSRAPGYPGPYQPFPDPSQRPASH